MSAKKLGPPKGAAETTATARETVLGQRFGDNSETPAPTSETTTPAPEVRAPDSYTPHTHPPKRAPRTEPAGMTRKSYYLSQNAADALDQAVAKILAATGGRITKHEALAALITAGAAQADTVTAKLRDDLLRQLQS